MNPALAGLTAALAGRYRLERELGQGGMATVYLALDLRHHRKVAIKVLRPELAAVIGAERFVQEIRTIAALQHPHILGLIDSGEVQGTAYFVMPFIEGESLRDRLAREKQLPVGEAIRIATEVAGALAYAHRHGVIHRDIKPENILLHDGSALVADFGIALAVSSAGGTRMTETGMSLGTPHYMSPEQAMGEREITARSDVYALGVVTYEMLTGDPPFTGSTAQAIVARVVTEDPRSIISQRRTVPPEVEDAVLVALSKLPADRFGSAAEFAQALAGGGGTTTRRAVRAAPGAGTPWRRVTLVLSALLVATTGVAAWSLLRGPAAGSGRTYRFEVYFPASEQISEAPGRVIALAPDGSGFVYVGVGPSSARKLYYHRFDRLESEPLEGTEDGEEPFFSPDGLWVGFRSGKGTSKVALAGGGALPLAPVASRYGAWLEDGSCLFVTENGGAIVRSSPDGRAIDTVILGTEGEKGRRFGTLAAVPGGRYALVSSGNRASTQVGILRLADGRLELLADGRVPAYAVSGHIVFTGKDGLMALPFDRRSGRPRGEPVRVLAPKPGESISDFALSANGSLLLLNRDGLRRSLVEVDRAGRERQLLPALSGYDSPRYSPDGRRLTVRQRSAEFHIWVHDLARGTASQLSIDSRLNYYPEWWPDGARIFWSRNQDESIGLYWKAADGSGAETALYDGPNDQYDGAVSRDGRLLVVRQNDSATGRDLWLVRLPEGKAAPLLATPASEHNPKLSPDGRLLAYVSNASGRAEVYVRTFPDSGGTWPVSHGGGAEPLWSPSGHELFYRDGDAIVAVPVETRPTFSAGRPDTLFTGLYVPNANHTNYDVHPDGQRFVMVRMAEGERRALVVLNWAAELARGTGGR